MSSVHTLTLRVYCLATVSLISLVLPTLTQGSESSADCSVSVEDTFHLSGVYNVHGHQDTHWAEPACKSSCNTLTAATGRCSEAPRSVKVTGDRRICLTVSVSVRCSTVRLGHLAMTAPVVVTLPDLTLNCTFRTYLICRRRWSMRSQLRALSSRQSKLSKVEGDKRKEQRGHFEQTVAISITTFQWASRVANWQLNLSVSFPLATFSKM